MIVISMFFMFQEVYCCTVLYDCNFYVLYVQEVYCCTVLYNCNFYVLYVPGSLLLYCSL